MVEHLLTMHKTVLYAHWYKKTGTSQNALLSMVMPPCNPKTQKVKDHEF